MENVENAVAQHYGTKGLLARIFAGLEAAGIEIGNLQPDDLAPVDEFHLGGRPATAHAVAKMALAADHHVLDVGCGIGGAVRYIAAQTGCRVTGIDLTPEYILTAKELTDLTGQTAKVTYETGSALDMPFADATFDAAITIHVAMNIHDRAALYGEIARVMKPGAVFSIYDLMRKGDGELTYPVPWAQTAQTSHLVTPGELSALLGDAGFDVGDIEDRAQFALDFVAKAMAAAADGPPPLGIHILMGPDAKEKLGNSLDGVKNGCIAPVQVTAKRRAG